MEAYLTLFSPPLDRLAVCYHMEQVSSVFHDAWAYTGELAEDSMWHELKTRNSLMPRLGHTLVECGDPLSAVMFGGLETNFYNR